MISSIDFYPTLIEMTGIKPKEELRFDGISIVPALKGGKIKREAIYCHYPHFRPETGQLAGTYVRSRDWKLIRLYAEAADQKDRFELYNLREDIGESNDLAAKMPQKVKELNARIEAFLRETQSLGAQPPYIINTTVANNQADFVGARSLTDGPLRTADPNAPGQNRLGISPNFRIPYVQQWNLAIHQQAPLGMQVTVAYVGTKATRLPQRPNINQAVPGDGAVNLRRRWPQHAGVFFYETRVNAVYHSLQASLVKRLSQGLHYQLSYTYSHLIDEESRNVEPIPITNLSLQRGNGDWDIRHNMRTTFGYELPFGRGKKLLGGVNPIVDGIMGGWEVVGALSLYTGLPFSIFAASNTLNIGEGSYSDRLRDGTLSSNERTLQRWFDVAAFANPGFRVWGNAGRNILFGPGTKQLDFSIFKNFKIHEQKTLQFRAEFFNFTNSPQFNNPNAGLGSPATGSIQTAGSEATAQRTQRLVQLALKFAF